MPELELCSRESVIISVDHLVRVIENPDTTSARLCEFFVEQLSCLRNQARISDDAKTPRAKRFFLKHCFCDQWPNDQKQQQKEPSIQEVKTGEEKRKTI